MIRREHDAARREHDVEARVLVGHLLGVPDVPLHLDALLRAARASRVDEDGREIHSDDVGAALCGKDRDSARAGGGVEHALAWFWVGLLDDECVDVPDRVRDALVRPVAPHHALALLQLCECHRPLLLVSGVAIIGRTGR